MRILLAIGCNVYDCLDDLNGAERDAERIFTLLTGDIGEYDPATSELLRSPSLDDVRAAFKRLYRPGGIDVLTLFFAGHGVVKLGKFYACVRDSNPEQLAMSALSIQELLAMVSEVYPSQVNVILDACESGGAMLDLGVILNEEILGPSGSFNLVFLAAAASDQYAHEIDKGGIATDALIEYLSGTKEVQHTRPYLDLMELGRPLSADVSHNQPDQVPVTWGLSLYGEARFARNPYYRHDQDAPPIPIRQVAPRSALGAVLDTYADALWNEYAKLSDEVVPARLLALLFKVADSIKASGTSVAPFLRAAATSFATRARVSRDPLGAPNALACAAVATLRFRDEPEVEALAGALIREWLEASAMPRSELLDALRKKREVLINTNGAYADLFYLPLRISKVLGWLGAEVIVRRLIGEDDREARTRMKAITTIILRDYPGAVASVSDAQGTPLYIFAKAAEADGDVARDVLNRMFRSFVESGAAVASLDLPPDDVFFFAMQRAHKIPANEFDPRLLANPSNLLGALLVAGLSYGCQDWDFDLNRIDHRYLNLFVPNSYLDFASEDVIAGVNVHLSIGNTIWTIEDFRSQMEATIRPMLDTAAPSSAEHRALAVLASFLLPDRTPYFLELS